MSTSLFLPIHGIIARSFSPTSSIVTVRRKGAFTHLDEKLIVANAIAAFNGVKARAGVS